MATGVTADGFVLKRIPEIRAGIIQRLQENTGKTFETNPDSFTGRFIDTFVEEIAYVLEQQQATYLAMYPNSAEGVNLDNAVAFSGSRRLQAKRTVVYATIFGDHGTVVPALFSVRATDTKKLYQLFRPVTLSKGNTNDITLIVKDAEGSQEFSIGIDGGNYSFVSSGPITGNDAAIRLSEILAASEILVQRNAAQIRIYTENPFKSMNVITSTNIDSFSNVGTMGTFLCTEVGPILAPVGTVTQIVNSLAGVDSISNSVEGVTGRFAEKDEELRQRYKLGVFRLGAGNPNAIRANVLENVANVQYCEVYENKTNAIDANGLPPKTMEIVVEGGDDQAVAEEAFRVWPGGIPSYGTTVRTVKDSGGNDQQQRLSRPQPIYFWVKVNVVRYNEEDFPGNGAVLIRDSIAATGNTFGVGQDVIPQRLYGDIYSKVAGIRDLEILLAISTNPTAEPSSGEYVEATFPISSRQNSRFNIKRVEVEVA